MAQGERKRPKRSEKDANAEQNNPTRNGQSLANLKKEKGARDTERSNSEQNENVALAKEKKPNS